MSMGCINYESTDSFSNLNQEVVYEMDTNFSSSNRPYFRDSTALTEKLLEDIKRSIFTFRPSKSLQSITSMKEDDRNQLPVTEIDVVISGGGLKGYFMAGASSVLLSELNKQNIKIARIAGASAGSW